MSEIDDKLYLARICHLSGLHEEALNYIEEGRRKKFIIYFFEKFN